MLKRRLVGDRYLIPPGQELRGQQTYRIESCVGGGAFSSGYRARAEDGRACFIKEFLPPPRPSERDEYQRVFEQEVDVMRRIGSYELVPLLWEAFSQYGFRYIVEDLVPGRSLDTLLDARTQFDEETLVLWCCSLVHALAFLHSRSVV